MPSCSSESAMPYPVQETLVSEMAWQMHSVRRYLVLILLILS